MPISQSWNLLNREIYAVIPVTDLKMYQTCM
jgi:hypothetical protein